MPGRNLAVLTEAATRLAADHERKLAALEAEKTALTTRCEKLETAANDARATAQAAEQKLKARAEEIRGLTAQLGEASEELAELRDKAARFEANLAAAAQTRASLEQEVTRLEAQLASAPAEGVLRDSPASHDEVRELRGQLQENERELAAWESKAKELEAELLVTSQAHRQLAAELERLRSAAPAGDVDAALAAELDAMSRERNALAAELAALRAERPSRKET